ncbi:MAG: thioredoxin fold domain-containing protein, partial [Rubripirellula sp.]|nr:thioredoxin fold domain-containing protein [Rubripirellula sp.]
HTQAQAEGKLLLLHFYSDNCKYCDLLEEGSFKAPQVNSAIGQNFVPVKIHANSSPKLTEMFRVTKFPTDVIVTIEGKTLAHTVSPQNPDRYVAMLQGTLSTPAQQPAAAPQSQIAANQAPAYNQTAAANQYGPTTNVQSPQISQPVAAQNNAASASAMAMPTPSRTQAQLASTGQGTPSFAMPTIEGAQITTAQNRGIGQSANPSFTLPTQAPAATSVTMPTEAVTMPTEAVTMPTEAVTMPTPSENLTAPTENFAVPTESFTAPTESLPTPTQNTATPAEEIETAISAVQADAKTEQPELAMQGYCAVTVINENKWIEGTSEFGVIHLGKLYLFTTEAKMQMFLADPMPFTPVLNEIDVVRFFEERKVVPGKREWGLKDPIHNRMFFFADEAAMNHFYNQYERYTDAAIEVMEKAVKDANPES